jgi:multidrug efflux pump
MKFTDIFIRRPVLAICVNLLILVAGLQSIRNLIVRQYPKSDIAVVTVKTVYVGADAELVRGFVTTPLERSIASADGIDYLESSSAQGLSTITAHLTLNYNTNDALTQIQAKVAQVRNDLPPEAEAPTIDVENSDNRFAAMYISFYSDELEQNEITDYLTRVVQPKLSSVSGVQRAEILGARTFAMRIWLKPDRMAALHISPSQVRDALAANNFLSAIGNTKGSMITVNLVANTDLKNKADFEKLVVRRDGDTLIRLADIADVVLGAEDYEQDVRFGGQSATFMGIWVLPNANSLDVIQGVREAIPEIQQNLLSGMKIGIPYDSTEYIRNAIHEVIKTLTETILIVICVIYLFLGSFRSVLVPVVAIPLSLIGAAGLMLVFGFTINLLTLLAIVLSVGLVVDDAIVMLENVERHVQEGMTPFDAAIAAARELVGPIIAMTITLATVYAPIGIQGGLTGTLFREFAFTLAGAVVVSGVVALTLSPMMSSQLLRGAGSETRFQKRIERVFHSIRENYSRALTRSLQYRPAVLVIAAAVILCLPPFYLFSMKELAPKEDQGVVFGIVQASPNSSLDQTMIYASEINKRFRSFPEYANSFQLITPTGGFSGMLVKPWGERKRTTLEIEGEAWGKMAGIPGVRMIVTTPPPLPGGSDFPIEFVISSTADPEQLVGFANQLVQKAFQSGKFMFADTDLRYDLPQSRIVLDRDKVAALGLDLSQVGQDLSVMTGGNYVNRFNIQGRSYKVIPQLKRRERLNPDQLTQMYVTGPEGSLVPLSTFAHVEDTVQPRQLNRFQQLNSAKIQGAVVPGVSVDEGLKVLEQAAAEILPHGYVLDYAGESRQLRKEQSTMLTTLILALVLIFLVLAAQFESFRDPLIILAGSVPLALAGALALVFLNATTLNIYSQVGLVTLVGLIAKNGILIVEFANVLQEQGRDKFTAVIEAATTRLRPILMTTVATVVGHFPLVLATGAGAGARNSIGIVLVSGMIIGTLFTLFAVPTIYTVVARVRKPEFEPSAENEDAFGPPGSVSLGISKVRTGI